MNIVDWMFKHKEHGTIIKWDEDDYSCSACDAVFNVDEQT